MDVQTRNELNTLCGIICDLVHPSRIFLFGSYAYGTPDKCSDYDICVVLPDNSMRPVDAVRIIRRALYKVLTTPIDLLFYHDCQFNERTSLVSLERKIAKEGVLLYERQNFG